MTVDVSAPVELPLSELHGITTSVRVTLARATSSSAGILIFDDRLGISSAMTGNASLVETLEILSDPDMVRAIQEGDDAVAAGDIVSLEDFRRTMGRRRG